MGGIVLPGMLFQSRPTHIKIVTYSPNHMNHLLNIRKTPSPPLTRIPHHNPHTPQHNLRTNGSTQAPHATHAPHSTETPPPSSPRPTTTPAQEPRDLGASACTQTADTRSCPIRYRKLHLERSLISVGVEPQLHKSAFTAFSNAELNSFSFSTFFSSDCFRPVSAVIREGR